MSSSSYAHLTGNDESSFHTHLAGKEITQNRNWMENLPHDVVVAIMQKVGTIDILNNIQNVCVSWRKICQDPALWKSIDMHHFGDLLDRDVLVEMTKHAIDRSCGQLIDINLVYFGNDDLLKYITDRKNQLRRLRIVMCRDITDEGLSEASENLSSIEELHIYLGDISLLKYITHVGLYNVGCNCPVLKSLTFNQQGAMMESYEHDFDPNTEALAISRTMPQLRHLSLFGNHMTDIGLQAILDACPSLESLDLRKCFKINLSGELGRRCSFIKTLKLPNDSTNDYDFDYQGYEFYYSYDDDDYS
ncbi:putative F-box/LRR-repeat protein 23 [Impatiens glandulifera]|uniref:putative F-box/LRR-repeat protein 23 n=1 Tax=Impatiens glandulifera TaxID=253017 RepID=UPI001FB145D3|nr:putative F-box/LRR-repeat protein 23 [Impatiens glandulifera]